MGVLWLIWYVIRKPNAANRKANRGAAFRLNPSRMKDFTERNQLARPSRPALLTFESLRRARAGADAARTSPPLNP